VLRRNDAREGNAPLNTRRLSTPYGSERLTGPCLRFLQEIPGELIDTAEGSLADAGETRPVRTRSGILYSEEEFVRGCGGRHFFPALPATRQVEPRSASHPRLGARLPANPLVGQPCATPLTAGNHYWRRGDGEDRKFTSVSPITEQEAHGEIREPQLG